jgi:hypothetical protein
MPRSGSPNKINSPAIERRKKSAGWLKFAVSAYFGHPDIALVVVAVGVAGVLASPDVEILAVMRRHGFPFFKLRVYSRTQPLGFLGKEEKWKEEKKES